MPSESTSKVTLLEGVEPDVPVRVREATGEQSAVQTPNRARQGMVLVLISAAAFGAMPVFAKLAYAGGMNVKTLLALRFSLAAVGMWLMWAFVASRGEKAPGWKDLPALVAMGALGYVGQSFSYFTAASLISASATGLLLYTYPAVVTLLAWAILKERMTKPKLAALGMSLVGALLVLGLVPIGGEGGAANLGALNPQGVFWGLSAAVIYSAYIIAGARFTTGVSPIFASAVIISSAAAVYLVWGSLAGDLSGDFQLDALGWALAIALLSTIVAIATFFAGLRTTGASRASIISTVEPAVTVILAGLVLSDRISLGQLAGGALILGAVLVVQASKK